MPKLDTQKCGIPHQSSRTFDMPIFDVDFFKRRGAVISSFWFVSEIDLQD